MIRYFLAALTGLLLTTYSFALDSEPFSEQRFESLQAEGALVLVDVWATWCPTCKRQREILAEFQDEHPEVDFTILEVDFDDDKNWVKKFRAPRQSTLTLYRGEEQIWFSVAETREDVIFEQLLNAAGSN
ncbi:MAG: thioredoxin family protein [Pseudomonadota bacterium]